MKNNWLFLGPEQGQKRGFLQELKANLTSQYQQELETCKFYAFETAFAEILSHLCNGGLFCSHRLVIVESVHEYKKADLELIKNYLKHPSPDSTLVLLSDETKLEALTKIFAKQQIKIFWEMFENQKKGWVINHFKELGLIITSEAVEFFLEMVENSTDQIRFEAQKLRAFFDKGTVINLEDLETYLVHTKEENVFTLFERFTEGHFLKALETLKKILDSKESGAISLLGGFVWQLKNLLQFQIKLSQHSHPEEVFLILNIRSKKARANYLQGARNYSLRELQRILVLTTEYNYKLRSFRTDHHGLIMDLYLYYAMIRKGLLCETPQY